MTYWVCSDNISGNEQADINTVVQKLNEAGKQARSAGVGPNKESLRNSKPAGDVIVFMVGGGQAGATWSSFAKYYDSSKAKTMIAYCGWSGSDAVKCERAQTDELVIEHDAGGFAQSWMKEMIDGQTVVTFVQKYSDCFEGFCCSNESAADLGEKIASGGCGMSSDQGEGTQYTTIKEALRELLSYWDGKVECYIHKDTCYVNKVRDPIDSCERVIEEGYNVIADSVNLTDINPTVPNIVSVKYDGGTHDTIHYELKDRFGKVKYPIDGIKWVAGKSKRDPTTSEPISSDREAESFGNMTMRELLRDAGWVLECQVIAHPKWVIGEWAHVILPSLDFDQYMYITKVSVDHSDDEWVCNLTLAPYPPSLGQYEEKESSSTDKEDDEENSEESENTNEDQS